MFLTRGKVSNSETTFVGTLCAQGLSKEANILWIRIWVPTFGEGNERGEKSWPEGSGTK